MCLSEILILIIFDFLVIQAFSLMEILNLFSKKWNSIETPFNDSNHPVSIDLKYHDIYNFSKLNINKNSSLVTLHLYIASLSKHFEDLQNFLSLLKHSFDIIEFQNTK